MSATAKLKAHRHRLLQQYKKLVEEAYNLRETDSAQSDISEYSALKLLDELNRLNFLERDSHQCMSC